MTKVETGKIKRWFQKNIGLAGWRIDITVDDIPPPELRDDICPDDRSKRYGRTQVYAMWRTSVVWVNPAAHTIPRPDRRTNDQVETLLHELLHGFFVECSIGSGGSGTEWCLNQLATVLAKQYRADSG